MTTCSVCRSARVAEADQMVGGRRPVAAVARQLGLSRQALGRHLRSGHVMPPQGTASGEPPDLSRLDGASAERLMRDIVASLHAIDVRSLSPAAQIALFAERRRAAEALARVGGATEPQDEAAEVERLIALPAYRALEAVEMDALEPFPEARRALALALRRYLAELKAGDEEE